MTCEKEIENYDCSSVKLNSEMVEKTKRLLVLYYTGKLSRLLKLEISQGLKSFEADKKAKVLELFYDKGWHTERIAEAIGCRERRVNRLAKEFLDRLTISIWGVDSFNEEDIFPG